ncbi:hypothetical protein RQP46_006190 [Phenoliferia psychrophenolica]
MREILTSLRRDPINPIPKEYKSPRLLDPDSDSDFDDDLPRPWVILGLPSPRECGSDFISPYGYSSTVRRVNPDLAVKIGVNVVEAEGCALQFVEANLPTVPAPKFRGFYLWDGRGFLFMTLIAGRPLDVAWRTFTDLERTRFSESLKPILDLVSQAPIASHIGGVSPSLPARTRVSRRWRPVAPFASVAAMHEFILEEMHKDYSPRRKEAEAFQRRAWRDNVEIVFSHGDLAPWNIMVSDDATVEGLIDWELAGFYPSPAQPKIASFAPELIDEILHHLVAGLDEYPTSYSRLKEIGEYSLISQNWQGPVQRRLMRRLVIKSGTQARRVVDGLVASGLGIHVKDLTIRFSKALWHYSEDLIDEPTSDQIKAVDAVTSDDFLALLPHFPALISLDLDGTPFTQLGPSEIFDL